MADKGLTFLEIVIALFLFVIVMVGFLQIFNTALDASHRATQEIIATNLARGLMAEIMSKEFEEPGSGDPPPALGQDSGESGRSDYDDADDYDDLNETPPVTVGGDPMDGTVPGVPNYSDFTRSVNVGYCIIDGSNNIVPDSGPTEYKQITVTVSGPYVRDIIVDEVKAE